MEDLLCEAEAAKAKVRARVQRFPKSLERH